MANNTKTTRARESAEEKAQREARLAAWREAHPEMAARCQPRRARRGWPTAHAEPSDNTTGTDARNQHRTNTEPTNRRNTMAKTTNVFETNVANLVFRTTPGSLWHVVEADENTATIVCVANGGKKNVDNVGKTKTVSKDRVLGAFRLVEGAWACTGLPNSF